MYTSRFQNARVLLAEPNTALREKIVGLLKTNGFGEVVQTGNMAGVRDHLTAGEFDLLIADTVMPEGDLCELVWRMRHAQIGDNPFIVVVALITERTSGVVRRAVNAGVDDVLLKPFEPEQLFERVNTLVRGRKRFVVTTDYIGPDRRTRARAESEQVPLIRVPNPLEMRTTGGMTRLEMQRVVAQAYGNINREKVERHVHQLDWLAVRMQPHIDGIEAMDPATFESYLSRLVEVARDLSRRIRTTPLSHLTALCMTLERVSRECAAEPNSKDQGRWNLLLRLLDSLPRACDPARGGVAPRADRDTKATGVSPLLDSQQRSLGFGPGGRFTRSA
jgi:DNA-binding response OmpR family regulator